MKLNKVVGCEQMTSARLVLLMYTPSRLMCLPLFQLSMQLAASVVCGLTFGAMVSFLCMLFHSDDNAWKILLVQQKHTKHRTRPPAIAYLAFALQLCNDAFNRR